MSALGQSAAQKAVAVLTRRAYIYRYMNSLIAKPDQRCSDVTITGLCFAGLIESRIGSIESARRHLGVVRHSLIPERGGIQEIAEHVSKPISCIIIWVGLEFHAFENWHALDSAVNTFVQIMSAIGTWMAKLSLHGKPTSTTSQTEKHVHTSSPFFRFLKNHKQLFNRKSPFHRFIGPTCYEGANSISIQIRSHMALLWLTNKILWELRDDITMSAKFLESFYRWILSSDDPTPFGFGRTAKPTNTSVLKTLTIVGMMGFCSAAFVPEKNPAAIDWTSGGKMNENRHILRMWEAIDMLELLHLLSEESRRRVLCQLSAWLIGPEPGQSSTMLNKDDFEDLGDEMRLGWLDMVRRRHLKTAGKE
ncbi:hypothetical protein H2200_012641 [Cladophialophora chaetospira]|uniref:Uncharacterized protein n=1 Tax=Cladophialophora chaetospira TaxID=386627 RepID=A0AA38WXA2_9EURO|nr:hypothetical protein H2200_012641 [Cladophialophora chaetospira]